ncbi:MAG: hypothetical protein V4662_25910 [Verrucomicrobiota bacterium]
MSTDSESLPGPGVADVTPRPSYRRAAFILWMIFGFMALMNDYDGITSIIGTPIIATFLTVIAMPLALLMGLLFRWSRARSWWYESRRPAATILILSLLVLTFGESLGFTQTYFDKELEVTRLRLHDAASTPSLLAMIFAVVYWPCGSVAQGRKQVLE